MFARLRLDLSCSHCLNPPATVAVLHQQLHKSRVLQVHKPVAAYWLCSSGPASDGKREQHNYTLRAAAAVTAPQAIEHPADTAEISADVNQDTHDAYEVLQSLSWYSPTGLSDGPASLTQVRPYNAAEVQHALDHGVTLLHLFSPKRLSNIAAALAAAGHLDRPFMEHLGHEAAQQLKAAPAAGDHVTALAELKCTCFLSVAYARLGVVHVDLMECIALRGGQLLRGGQKALQHHKYDELSADGRTCMDDWCSAFHEIPQDTFNQYAGSAISAHAAAC